MTVGELITKLQEYSFDTQVIYRLHSDYAMLEPEDITFASSQEQLVCLRGGRYCIATEYKHCWGKEKPEFVSALVFPGN